LSAVAGAGGASAAETTGVSPSVGSVSAAGWLATIKRLEGCSEAALEVLRRGLEADPANPQLYFQLAETLRSEGKTEEADCHYRAALALEGCPPEVPRRLASLQIAAGRFVEARRLAEEAVESQPDDAATHTLLGELELRERRFEQAAGCYRRALQWEPSCSAAHHGLGTALFKLGHRREAVLQLQEAVRLAPGAAGAQANLAEALAAEGRPHEALKHFRRAIELRPDWASVHLSLGRFLQRHGWFDEAMACLRNARQIDPDSAEVAAEMAGALSEMGRWQEAVAAIDRAAQLRPGWPAVRLNRALILLTIGRLREGWREYGWRWQAQAELKRPDHLPRWDGRPTAATVEAVCEQGLGTEVLFASCLPDLIGDVGHCIVRCDSRLVRLFARSFPEATVRAKGERCGREPASSGDPPTTEPHEADFAASTGDLPGIYRNDLADFPPRASYLVADSQRRRHWRDRLLATGRGCKVGISWRGGAMRDDLLRRSVPLDQCLPLFSVPDVQWINIQYGPTQNLLRRIRDQFGVVIHSFDQLDVLRDQDDLAALLAELDLVICVSNSTVHLAAGLGTPVWALVPRVPDWRWMLDRTDTPWHPTVRLFRQERPGDWSSALEAVHRALSQFVAESGGAGAGAEHRSVAA
jgi:tetratricopeptide (TPR) repeat protein